MYSLLQPIQLFAIGLLLAGQWTALLASDPAPSATHAGNPTGTSASTTAVSNVTSASNSSTKAVASSAVNVTQPSNTSGHGTNGTNSHSTPIVADGKENSTKPLTVVNGTATSNGMNATSSAPTQPNQKTTKASGNAETSKITQAQGAATQAPVVKPASAMPLQETTAKSDGSRVLMSITSLGFIVTVLRAL